MDQLMDRLNDWTETLAAKSLCLLLAGGNKVAGVFMFWPVLDLTLSGEGKKRKLVSQSLKGKYHEKRGARGQRQRSSERLTTPTNIYVPAAIPLVLASRATVGGRLAAHGTFRRFWEHGLERIQVVRVGQPRGIKQGQADYLEASHGFWLEFRSGPSVANAVRHAIRPGSTHVFACWRFVASSAWKTFFSWCFAMALNLPLLTFSR